MAKRETKESYNAVKGSQAAANREYDSAIGSARSNMEGSRGAASDTSKFEPLYGELMEFGRTGGYDDNRRKSIMENVEGLKTLGKYGAGSETDAARLRGLGVFDEFARTGGYTDIDKANIRARGLAPISSMYTGMKDELERRKRVQGGYAPGFDAASRALRRDTGRGIVDAALGTELEIMDRVNEGRRFGATGASQTEQAITDNKFRGLGMAGDMEMQLQNAINNYRLAGYSQAESAAKAIADINMNMYQSDANMYKGLLGDKYGTNLGYYGARNQLATQPGIGSHIMRGIGVGAGIGSMFFNPVSAATGAIV